eukprot:scaffold11.g3907.t1
MLPVASPLRRRSSSIWAGGLQGGPRSYARGARGRRALEVGSRQAAEAAQLASKAQLLERAVAAQQATLANAQHLAAEVSELAQQLHANGSHAADAGGSADEALTSRERLWAEKEAKEQQAEKEAAAGGGEAAEGAGGAEVGAGGGAASAAGGGGALAHAGEASAGEGAAEQQGQQHQVQLEGLAELLRQRQAQRLGAGSILGSIRQRGPPEPVFPPTPPLPDPPVVEWSAEELQRHRDAVREAMRHAWGSYVAHAWGHDELCPLTKRGKNSFGGLGATVLDSMDTLLMMGLEEEYARAATWVKTRMPLNASFEASVFETVIRVVGGALAAHHLSGDAELLRRAVAVAERVMPAYDTPTGIPYNLINLATQRVRNPSWNLRSSTLAEFGTHQLEFWQLSALTGDRTYAEKAEATIRRLHEGWPRQGLMPLFISPLTGNFTARKVSLGALGDSYYEYLLKMWLLKGKKDNMYRTMWEAAMDEMIARLVFTSSEGLTYIAEFDRLVVKHKMDHLVCFVPGMLALGARAGAVPPPKAAQYMEVAANVTRTCWRMYRTWPTGARPRLCGGTLSVWWLLRADPRAPGLGPGSRGLSPEYVTFTPSGGMRCGAPYNLLRPEAVEAFWYMWRVTKDWRYRAWGWEVFSSFQTHCRAEAGFAGIKDVRAPNVTQDDTQQSFFLAETLKYLWLLFSPDEAFDLDKWVLNTEAHPLKIGAGLAPGFSFGSGGGGTAVQRRQRRRGLAAWPAGAGGG